MDIRSNSLLIGEKLATSTQSPGLATGSIQEMTDSVGSMPFIKHEHDERANDPNMYMMSPNSFSAAQQQYGNNFTNSNHNQSIDPSDLSMQNGNYGMNHYSFGAQQNLSSSYNLGNSGFGDDELLEGLELNAQQGQMNDYVSQPHQNSNQQFTNQRHPTGISMGHQGQMTNVYSNTPEGPPIQSPFLRDFDYSQFKPATQHMSPHQNAHYDHGFNGAKRPSVQVMQRKSSDQRSPMTPRTPAVTALPLGSPESATFSSQPIRTTNLHNRHQKTLSTHLGSSPDSYGSSSKFLESPMSAPGHGSHRNGISEVLKSGQHASLPPKVGHGPGVNGGPNVEEKKRRRRDSHNQVERRRRDNINERIQDLSHLVPQHRLDDDKVKKQLQNNSPISANTGAASMSPPNVSNAATSLLAGATGRRAASTAGNITLGLPVDEKEKGPNKGDILTGAVGWTRDLMWALYQKYVQDEELAQHISQLGGTWPFELTDDERRMRSELMEAMEKNDASSFAYTRAHGTGLRVPKHTNMAGEPIQGSDQMSPQSLLELSPGFHSGGSGTNSGSGGPGQPQFWISGGHPGMSFKEEDEFMEMN